MGAARSDARCVVRALLSAIGEYAAAARAVVFRYALLDPVKATGWATADSRPGTRSMWPPCKCTASVAS